MTTDNRMTIAQWLAVGDILNEMNRKRTSKKRMAELTDALATWDAGARAHGFESAAAWRAQGYKASTKGAEAHARFLANSGISAEEWKAKYAMPTR